MNLFTLLFLLILCLFVSCRKDTDSCTQFLPCYILDHNGIYTGKAFEDIPIPIIYIWSQGCGGKGYLDAQKDGTVTSIRAFAAVPKCGDIICFDMPVSFTDTFYFRAPRPGTYYLKLISTNDRESMDTIVVQ